MKLNLSDRKNSTAVGIKIVYAYRQRNEGHLPIEQRKKRTPQVVANKLIANAASSQRNTPRSSRHGMSTLNGLTGTATRSTARSTRPSLVDASFSSSDEVSFSAHRVSRIAEKA